MPIRKEIQEYVERRILPRYDGFDKAHRQDHARMVITQSLELAGSMPDVNPEMAYVVAAFHDLGLARGQENHHADSRHILEADTFLRQHFTPEQIRLMGEAVEDHRASSQHPPRNRYGMIVAEADRFIDPGTIIRRPVQYGLEHYPALDRQGHYRRTLDHLCRKYGPDGYLKIWLPWSDNAHRLADLRKIIADQAAISQLFDRIFDQETCNPD